jgi:hypothetical protein
MFLSVYHFDGDPATLHSAHDRLLTTYPIGPTDLHLCLAREHGISVVDSCPSRDVFEAFSVSPEFRSALAEVGLPEPRVQPLGEVIR